MTDRPIIFSAAMTRALLAGPKTQTRRLTTSPLARCMAGERLWVREAFALDDDGRDEWLVYRSDGAALPSLPDNRRVSPSRWRPSIHMPRWASRLTLHVEAVRVERLQDISEADATAEGVEPDKDGAGTFMGRRDVVGGRSLVTPWLTAKEAFADLWNSLHGPTGWDANPDVVALTFRVERANIDAAAAAGAA